MQYILDKILKQDEIFLGDFNTRVGSEVLNGIKNRFNEEIVNESGEQLILLCAQNKLRINNSFYPRKPQHK